MFFKISPLARQYLLVITVNLGMLNLGLGVSWSSPVLLKLRDEDNPPLGRPVTDNEVSWIVSSISISSFLTLTLSAYLMDRIGRKYCVLFAAIPRIICYGFLTFATEVWMVIFGRVLSGFSDGFIFVIVAVYASEIASKDIRGSLGVFLQLFSSIGILVMMVMGPFLDYVTLNAILLCIAALTIIPQLFIPDSPYFLYKQGKINEARTVLEKLRENSIEVEKELKQYDTITDESSKISILLKSRQFVKALLLTIALGIGCQLTGYNSITLYLQTIFESSDSTVSASTGSIVIGCMQPAAALFAAAVSDRFGRKPILITSNLGMAVGMGGLGLFFYLAGAGHEVTGFLNVLPLLSVILCIIAYSPGTLVWPLIAELFDGRGRAIGSYSGVLSSNVIIFLIGMFFVPLVNSIGPTALYWAFSGCSLMLCVFIYLFVPETKGKTFAEIQDLLGGEKDRKG